MIKALPCINTQQFAAKTISKDQQTLTSSECQATERLSFHKLIISPKNYEGKKIQLTGYFVSDGAKCLVMANNKETTIMFREYEMVKVCVEKLHHDYDFFSKLDGNYGSIVGVFLIEKCGDKLKLGSSINYLGCFIKANESYGPIYTKGIAMPPPLSTGEN